jgi:hypothetical protein
MLIITIYSQLKLSTSSVVHFLLDDGIYLLRGSVVLLGNCLGYTRRALSLLAEESDNHLEVMDDQVTDIRASVGWRLTILSD